MSIAATVDCGSVEVVTPVGGPRATDIEARPSYERAVLGFVVLGVLLRVGHYLLNYPIWGDEAFVALNLPRRGYLDLSGPLDYGQICPILFLWAELTAVKLLGFSEMAMRLYPLMCGIGAVLLFRHVAGRLLDGRARLFAVAIFAVSIHPVRHSAEIKPYASDLFVALLLMWPAVEWCRSRAGCGWLWVLVGMGPIAVTASYPAALVAAGIGLALAPGVWRTQRWGSRLALLSFGLAVVGTFAILFFGYMHRQQSGGTLPGLQRYWSNSFPPLNSGVGLIKWLVETHTGSMLAYPGGGRRGASTGTFVLVLIAAAVLWRRSERTVLGLLVAPAAVTLLAAILRLYPYGGEARVMQFMAPAICLLAGLGLSTVLGWVRQESVRRTAVRLGGVGLAISAVALLALELRHPYRMAYDQDAREFARRFWPTQAANAEVGCLEWDFGLYPGGFPSVRTALYLCNQLIYSPSRHNVFERRLIDQNDRVLRCVAYEDVLLQGSEAGRWLNNMKTRYTLRHREEIVAPKMGEGVNRRDEHLVVFEFEPLRKPRVAGIAARGGELRHSR